MSRDGEAAPSPGQPLFPVTAPKPGDQPGWPQTFPPELLQNVYNFPKLVKAGTSTFPFPTPARHTHFFPKGSVKLQVGAVACQGMAGLTKSSKAWEILACFNSGSGLRRCCGSVRPTPCLLPAPGVSPSSSGAGILVLCTKSSFPSLAGAQQGPWLHKPAPWGWRSSTVWVLQCLCPEAMPNALTRR